MGTVCSKQPCTAARSLRLALSSYASLKLDPSRILGLYSFRMRSSSVGSLVIVCGAALLLILNFTRTQGPLTYDDTAAAGTRALKAAESGGARLLQSIEAALPSEATIEAALPAEAVSAAAMSAYVRSAVSGGAASSATPLTATSAAAAMAKPALSAPLPTAAAVANPATRSAPASARPTNPAAYADSSCNPTPHAGFNGGSLNWGMSYKVASAQEVGVSSICSARHVTAT